MILKRYPIKTSITGECLICTGMCRTDSYNCGCCPFVSHKRCLSKWLTKNHNCPICRTYELIKPLSLPPLQ